jgi:signal peptidase complex subunit 2
LFSSRRFTLTVNLDLKNTSDDAIPNYLNSLKFRQSHTLTDVRLALGYSAFLVAGACFLWDYKFGFESTKYYTAAAVAVYTLLNSALSLWIWGVEKGTTYVGTTPGGEKVCCFLPHLLLPPAFPYLSQISIATSTKKNIPRYNIDIRITPKHSSKPENISISRSFTEWFDQSGRFVAAPFQTMLATSVVSIGQQDPKRVAAPSAMIDHKYSAEELALLAAATAKDEATAKTTSSTPVKQGGKRRKA